MQKVLFGVILDSHSDYVPLTKEIISGVSDLTIWAINVFTTKPILWTKAGYKKEFSDWLSDHLMESSPPVLFDTHSGIDWTDTVHACVMKIIDWDRVAEQINKFQP